jgi:hypothetical protein
MQEQLLLLLGGALVGGTAVYFWQKRDGHKGASSAVPVIAPAAPADPALQNTAFPVSIDVTMAPAQNITQPVAVGTIVIAWLPLGGKWVSLDGAGITDPVTPQAFDFAGPITHTYVWTDSTGKTQTSVVNYVVATPTPSVTA